MKSYTESNNNNATSRDKIINDFVTASGMEKNAVVRMFESYQAYGNDMQQIKDKFDSMVSPLTSNPLEVFNDKSNIYDDNTFNTKVSTSIKEFVNSNPYDVVGLLNIMANALRVKNPNFAPIFKKLEICTDIPQILEYSKLDNYSLNENENVGGTVELYITLKDVLAKNNKRFGVSYHIQNVYNEIWDYLNKEIERLTTFKNIQTSSNDFKNELIDALLRNTINPMYRECEYIKRSCPDIQGLLFDMVAFFNSWVELQDKRVFTMINTKYLNEYYSARDNLIMSIPSSFETSKIIDYKNDKNNIWSNSEIDSRLKNIKLNIQNAFISNTVNLLNLGDVLIIIKNIQNEFNMNIRNLINNFVTKAANLLGRAEHIIYELNKISMYK